MSDLSSNSTQDIFNLLRQTYRNDPALSDKGCHSYRQIGQVCEFEEAYESRIADGQKTQTFYVKTEHGVAAGYWKTKNMFGLHMYQGEFYSKPVTIDHNQYTLQAIRYDGTVIDAYDIILWNEKLEEVARKTDDGDWTGYTDLLSVALATFCEIEDRALQGVYADPLNPRSRIGGYAVCKE